MTCTRRFIRPCRPESCHCFGHAHTGIHSLCICCPQHNLVRWHVHEPVCRLHHKKGKLNPVGVFHILCAGLLGVVLTPSRDFSSIAFLLLCLVLGL